jgi:hypothetical protein
MVGGANCPRPMRKPAPDRVVGRLHVRHRVVADAQALDRVELEHRQVDEHRHHLVAERGGPAGVPGRDGHHHPVPQLVGPNPAGAQVVAGRVGHDREHDVVDGGPERVLDVLDVCERDPLHREPPVLTRRPVQQRPGRPVREVLPRDRERPRGRPRPHVRASGRALRPGYARPHQLARGGGEVPHRVAGELGRRRCRRGRPRDRVRDLGGDVGLGVEQHGRDVHAGEAVDHRVVGLAEDGEPSLLEPLDDVGLPQRPVAVQGPRQDARAVLGQLRHRDPGLGRAACRTW